MNISKIIFIFRHLKKPVEHRNPFVKYVNSTSFYSTTPDNDSCTVENEEIHIPVPWGHISCVRWGPKDKQPIIALHGWQDNAGTWKPLIPLLPSNTSILAIDSPGHGNSSWYPPGMFYNFIDNPMTLRRIVKYFGWSSISLLGHSMGAITSFIYGSFFPDEVKSMILIDNLKPTINLKETLISRIGPALDLSLTADDRNIKGSEPPSYTFEELIERLHIGSHKSIDKDKCHYLLERAVNKSSVDENKYYFKRDSRLKHNFQFGSSPEHVRLMASRLKGPILHIKFESAPYFESKEYYMETLNMLKESNKNFEVYTVPGTHHGHLNTPNLVAPLINSFLSKHNCI